MTANGARDHLSWCLIFCEVTGLWSLELTISGI